MDLLQESTFDRLLARYERVFGEEPPFQVATLDDAIAFMRRRLNAADRLGVADTGGCPFAMSEPWALGTPGRTEPTGQQRLGAH